MTANALRPLSLGELLSQTFSHYGKHFWLFIGIMALPEAVIVGAQWVVLPLQSYIFRVPFSSACIDHSSTALIALFVEFGAFMLISFFVYALAFGATTAALSEIYQGRKTSISAAFGSLQGKILRLIGVVFNVAIRVIGAYIIFELSARGLVSLALFAQHHGHRGPAVIAIAVLGALFLAAAVVLPIICLLRYSLAVPALLAENLKPGQAITSSLNLAKGNLWRIFVASVMMVLINIAAIFLLSSPFWIVLARRHLSLFSAPLRVVEPMYVLGGIGAAITGPLLIIVLAQFYLDVRAHQEQAASANVVV